MHLDMIAVKFLRLSQFYDTLLEVAILYSASGWGICTPINWLSIKICCRMVDISPLNISFKEYLHSISGKIYNILC